MTSLAIGFSYSVQRLAHRSFLFWLVAGVGFSIFIALLERQGAPGAVDRSLTGVGLGLALPLGAFLTMRRLSRGRRLVEAFKELAEQGADRRQLALGQAGTAVATSVAFGFALGVVTVLAARDWNDPMLLTDSWVSSGVGALAGATYACAFLLAATFGKNGGGCAAFLLLDWSLGSTGSALALPFPRGHVMNLLGASSPMNLSQPSSAAALTALIFLCLALAISRIPR